MPPEISCFIVPPPQWKTPDEAIEYLRSTFAHWCRVMQDLLSAGIAPPELLAHDMAGIAEGLAAFLRDPSEPVEADDQRLDPEARTVGELARCLTELGQRIEGGSALQRPDGLGADVYRETRPLLCEAIASAAKVVGAECAHHWDREMAARERGARIAAEMGHYDA